MTSSPSCYRAVADVGSVADLFSITSPQEMHALDGKRTGGAGISALMDKFNKSTYNEEEQKQSMAMLNALVVNRACYLSFCFVLFCFFCAEVGNDCVVFFEFFLS